MNWQELPDRKLVELCLERNEDAWVELLRRYRRLIAGVAARTILRSLWPADGLVQDLVEDSIVRICANEFRALRELEWQHEGALRGLLQVVASTTAQDYLRKALSPKRDIAKEKSLEEPGLVVPVQERFAERVEQKILMEQLVRCLKKLIHSEPDCTRDIAMFLLFYGWRVTAADLARLYRLNVRKVENILAKLSRLARSNCL
jgi:RNA polymerase sigma factor (sigma-70 family)